MEVGIVSGLFRGKISQPFDGIVWLFVIATSFEDFSLPNDRSEELPRRVVALPDGSKLGDEVLYDRAKPRMKESEFRRGEEDVFRVLWRVSRLGVIFPTLFRGAYIATYLDPLFILMKAVSNKNLSIDSAYEP